MQRVGYEASKLPTYEGLPNLASFLIDFEVKVTESQCLSALDFVLKSTPTRWWGMHKEYISKWTQCRRLMEIRFGEWIYYSDQKYTRLTNPMEHIEHCRSKW